MSDVPSLAVDLAILTTDGQELKAVVLRRNEPPDGGMLALLGGTLGIDESLEQAALRILLEQAQLQDVFVEQLYTFGHPRRDPRKRTISVVYYALVDITRLAAAEIDPALLGTVHVPWEGEAGGPVQVTVGQGGEALAFDHGAILGSAVLRIRGKLDYSPIGFQLLGERFTLRALQQVHETILGKALNKDSFRRRMLASGLLAPTGEREQEVEHRPAELYRFTRPSAV